MSGASPIQSGDRNHLQFPFSETVLQSENQLEEEKQSPFDPQLDENIDEIAGELLSLVPPAEDERATIKELISALLHFFADICLKEITRRALQVANVKMDGAQQEEFQKQAEKKATNEVRM